MRTLTVAIVLSISGLCGAQVRENAPRPAEPPAAPANLPDVTPQMVQEAIAKGVGILLAMEEGDGKGEWPYEGVYRVNRQIPVGYRVGGTGIVVEALARAPGAAEDAPRLEAIGRGVDFMCAARTDPTMSIDDYAGGYDVRAWGYIEAVRCLCVLKRLGRMPEGREEKADEAIRWYLDALHRIEIPEVGGWNYARGPKDQKAGPSPFMTARGLQALFEAKASGYEVNPEVVDRALTTLDKARSTSGSMVYSGEAGSRELRRADATPGAVGRMASAETTLVLAGRGRERDVRGAVDAFIAHWPWLEQRRQQQGTHVPPFMVAPYYFMFAHLYAAQGIEQLPAAERPELRRRVQQLLFSVREEDGSWNDRVFKRSGAYGTAMAMLTLMQPEIEPAGWEVKP